MPVKEKRIALWCPQEQSVMGVIVCAVGEKITAEVLSTKLQGRHRKAILENARTGSPFLCPRCKALLLLGEERQPIEKIEADHFTPLLGNFFSE